MVFLRKLQLKEIEIIAFLYTDNFQNLKFKCQSKLKQAKISDKKEQRFGDIVTPFSSSNAKKDKQSENSLKINILRNCVCNVTRVVLLQLSPTEIERWC